MAVRGNLEACRAKIYAIDALKGCMNLLRIHESKFDAVEQEDERCVHGKLDKDWESSLFFPPDGDAYATRT